MITGTRRDLRERILSLLYEAEMKATPVTEVIAGLPVTPDDFVVQTAEGVDAATSSLDEVIEKFARDWDLDRMAVVDRAILRIGIWELRERADLSVAIVITEAVELAKRFSTDDSSRFVNGILSAAGSDIRP